MDTIRFAIEPILDEGNRGFEVQIFVNGIEMTRAGAGLGMDTNDLLIPEVRFRPKSKPHQVAVARCDCGVYGCGSTDVMITAEDSVVHWDWLIEKPMHRRVTFDRAQYDQAVDLLDTDRSWETPEREAVRIVATACRSQHLEDHGLQYSGAADHYADRSLFEVSLILDDEYQLFLRTPWAGRTAEHLAADVMSTISTDPRTWEVLWSGMTPESRDRQPRLAGPGWTQRHF